MPSGVPTGRILVGDPDGDLVPPALVIVEKLEQLPPALSGVITLLAGVTYFFVAVVDLLGARLVAGENTVILGASSENCRILSTGLGAVPLISSVWSLPVRNITIEATLALDLQGDGTTTALDWSGVNFTDCVAVGLVKDYTNFIITDCALLNSGGLTLDGTIGSFGANSCLFDGRAGTTTIILPATLTFTRRFRVIYSAFVVLAGETGVAADLGLTIPDEAYILDVVSFGGGGTCLSGIPSTDNRALFTRCTSIENTFVAGQLSAENNATVTPVALANTFYKALGSTVPSATNSRFTATDNRLTCNATIERKYFVSASISFLTNNNNVCTMGVFDSRISAVRTTARTKSTANGSGRSENVAVSDVVSMSAGDYIEIHVANNTAPNSITAQDITFLVTEIN